MEEECITFDVINTVSRTIANRFKDRGITHVIGIARGGLVPATIISYMLDETRRFQLKKKYNFLQVYSSSNSTT